MSESKPFEPAVHVEGSKHHGHETRWSIEKETAFARSAFPSVLPFSPLFEDAYSARQITKAIDPKAVVQVQLRDASCLSFSSVIRFDMHEGNDRS